MDEINTPFQRRNVIPFPSCPQIKIKLMHANKKKCYALHVSKSFKPCLVTFSENKRSQPSLAELKASLFFLNTQFQFKRFLFRLPAWPVIHATLRRHWAMNSPRY
jgi:hypothetical protein